MDNKIMLFSNCIPVKGTNRSVLYDLQRNNYQFIPNSLFELLKNHEKENINDIKKHYKNKYDSIIDDYFDFLLKKEYVFLTKEPELFPNLNLNWDNSAVITNSILCFLKKTNHSLKKLSVNLELFNTKALQFRFFYQFVKFARYNNNKMFATLCFKNFHYIWSRPNIERNKNKVEADE